MRSRKQMTPLQKEKKDIEQEQKTFNLACYA